MDLPRETLNNYWEFLKQCEYPNIIKMDEADVQKIFKKENRTCFLTWALIKLIPDYNNRIEVARNNNSTETLLGELIQSNGFCKTSEKMSFVSQQLSMKVNQEIPIFNRIFISLSALHSNIDKENLHAEVEGMKHVLLHPSRDYFKNTILCDNEVFPSNGAYKKLSEKERRSKIECFKKSIDALDIEIKEAELKREKVLQSFENEHESHSITNEEIEMLVKKLNEVTSIFQNEFLEYSSNFSKIPEVPTNDELGNILEKTDKNLNHILKVLENQNYLKNQQEISVKDPEITSEKYSDFIMKNYVISEEIIEEFDINQTFNSETTM